VDVVNIRPGQIPDRDGVDAAAGGEVDVLDSVDVHGDGGDVAGEPHPRAIGRDVDVLGNVGAVEQHRVVAGLALDDVGAIARVPDERIVARAHARDVVALGTDD